MDCPGSAVAYSPDGSMIALGFKNGGIIILDAESLAVKNTKKDRTKAITEIKFSPLMDYMVVGAHDSFIMVYDIKTNFKLVKKLRGHHSTVLHIDFLHDGSA